MSEDLILLFRISLERGRVMLKNFRDKIGLSGIIVLMMGVALLIFTFVSAYGFLTESLSIIASADLVQTFGEALAPLIATCIRVMYLGVMGWIGSLLTIRGVTIIAHAPKMPKAFPQEQAAVKPTPQKVKAKKIKKKDKQVEPEVVVIPPEQVSQSQPPDSESV